MSIEVTPARLVFQKVIRDHGGPGVDVHREFHITDQHITCWDDCKAIETTTFKNPAERARWIAACKSSGYTKKP